MVVIKNYGILQQIIKRCDRVISKITKVSKIDFLTMTI